MKRHAPGRANLSLPDFATWGMFFKNRFSSAISSLKITREENQRDATRCYPWKCQLLFPRCQQFISQMPTIQFLLDKEREASEIFGHDGLQEPRSCAGRQQVGHDTRHTAAGASGGLCCAHSSEIAFPKQDLKKEWVTRCGWRLAAPAGICTGVADR